jgi:tetratricopeptide (TPR) repeat protein
MEQAGWSFLKSVEYARRTRKKNGSRIRGISQSCLESGCLEEAVEAARYLRVEDRCRVLAEVAAQYAQEDRRARAQELLEEAEKRLQANAQAEGSAKQRAYRAIAVAHHQLGQGLESERARVLGSQLDSSWPAVVAIRNSIEVAEMYHQCSETDSALRFAHTARKLSTEHGEGQMMVLTAVLFSELGQDKLAREMVQSLRGGFHDPLLLVQGFGRIGRADLALECLDGIKGKNRARGLYIASQYCHTKKQRQAVLKMVKGLDKSHRDWQMMQSVGQLCARTGDTRSAHRYYLASLHAYQRDWPQMWQNHQQRAFVLANYGRGMAESKLEGDSQTRQAIRDLARAYSWPQELKL